MKVYTAIKGTLDPFITALRRADGCPESAQRSEQGIEWSSVSVFLEVPEAAWVCANDLAFAFRDRFPVSPGHTLIVTRRVTPDWFSATDDEQRAVLSLIAEVKQRLDNELAPDGYNVGFNAGVAAGQTVVHLHVHVIPRYAGDVPDPRGGIRHVIPGRGNYLAR